MEHLVGGGRLTIESDQVILRTTVRHSFFEESPNGGFRCHFDIVCKTAAIVIYEENPHNSGFSFRVQRWRRCRAAGERAALSTAVTSADSIGAARTESLAVVKGPVAEGGCQTDEEKHFHTGGFRLQTATTTWAAATTTASRMTGGEPQQEGSAKDDIDQGFQEVLLRSEDGIGNWGSGISSHQRTVGPREIGRS